MKRIALITGATSGIGKATAEAFANAEIDLILCGRRLEVLDELNLKKMCCRRHMLTHVDIE